MLPLQKVKQHYRFIFLVVLVLCQMILIRMVMLTFLLGGALFQDIIHKRQIVNFLKNKKGQFYEVSNSKIPALRELGLVTAACWADFNADGLDDLVVVGEWMPITLFMQDSAGHFKKSSINESEGWYYSVEVADMDTDGDVDMIVGNLGLNYKYKASIEAPFEVYAHDFDDNGRYDIVLSYYEDGVAFPVRGKSCSSEQIPSIARNFKTFEAFGSSSLEAVYGTSLNKALHYKATTFASAFVENKGLGQFKSIPLSNEAQISCINSILIDDYDRDGINDVLIAGNYYSVEVETPRNDASIGLFLKGDGKGSFDAIDLRKSGFFTPNDTRDLKQINVRNQNIFLVANNDQPLQAIALIENNP